MANGNQIKEVVEIQGHSIKHIKNSYDDYWYFVYNSTPFEFETKEDAIKSLNDLIKKNKYAKGGGVGKNVRGTAYYITSDSAGDDYRYLSGSFLSKEEFDKFYGDDAILDFYFNVNVEYDWQLEKAIYQQMLDEEVREEGIHIIGYKIRRSDNDDIESNLPYDDENDEDEYAKGGYMNTFNYTIGGL